MIKQETAERLFNECTEIEDCKRALAKFRSRKLGLPTSFVNVAHDNDSDDVDGETVELMPGIAKEAIEKQLAFLTEQYEALNEMAVKEATEAK